MNFFMIGFAAALLHLNTSWISAYPVKAVGMLFILGGVAEIVPFSKGFLALKKPAYAALAVNILCTAAVAAVRLMGAGEAAVDISSIAAGTASAAVSVWTVSVMIRLLNENSALLSDRQLLERINAGFRRLAWLTMINLLCDGIYRASEESTAGAVCGAGQIATRIVLLVLLCTTTSAFNRAREDFDLIHSDDLGSDE